MSKGTPATLAAQKAGIAFTAVTYPYDPDADSIGLQAAAALGEPPGRDRRAHAGHQRLIVGEVVPGQQHHAENLAGLDEVVEIGA